MLILDLIAEPHTKEDFLAFFIRPVDISFVTEGGA